MQSTSDKYELEWTALRAVLERYGQRLTDLYRANMRESGRPASGALADSLRTEVVVGERAIAVDLSLLDYWKYIEHGTRPHWPPVDAIREWIRVKPVLPRPDAKGKLPTPNQLAYLIGRKISLEGTQGKDDLSRALQQTWEEFAQAVADAVTEDVTADLDWIMRTWLVA
jgi:hypothetical protein